MPALCSPPVWQVSHHRCAYHQEANPRESKSYPVTRRQVTTQQTNLCPEYRTGRVKMELGVTKPPPQDLITWTQTGVRVPRNAGRPMRSRGRSASRVAGHHGFGVQPTPSPQALAAARMTGRPTDGCAALTHLWSYPSFWLKTLAEAQLRCEAIGNRARRYQQPARHTQNSTCTETLGDQYCLCPGGEAAGPESARPGEGRPGRTSCSPSLCLGSPDKQFVFEKPSYV